MTCNDEDTARELQVVVSTHAIKGLSIYDFILAAKLDALPVAYSPKWLAAQNQESTGAAEPSCASLPDALAAGMLWSICYGQFVCIKSAATMMPTMMLVLCRTLGGSQGQEKDTVVEAEMAATSAQCI